MTSVLVKSLVAVSLLATAGCESARSEASPAPAAEASKVAAVTPPPVAAPAAAPASQQSYKEAEFAVAIEGPTSGKVGETLSLKVTLEAASGYKVNQEYPLKFQVHKAPGVVPEKDTVLKADATYEGHGASLPVKVKLESAGKHELGGRLSFSVCKEGDASVCLLEKRELGLTLDAS